MEEFKFEQNIIKGYPELRWTGKRPYNSTQFYPAQLKERYGEEKDNWINKIFWGDNLQVMSHMLKEYRGKIDLIYIDPPFDSKADYKKKIKVKGKEVLTDSTSFEEKQYGDIWTNDEYLQFMYERLILMKELLSDSGTIFLHCDWHKSHHIRMIMDEVFGNNNFVNEVIWSYTSGGAGKKCYSKKHDNIFIYSKTKDYFFQEQMYKRFVDKSKGYDPRIEYFIDEETGKEYRWNIMTDVWTDLGIISPNGFERTDYPTQKPEDLLKRIIMTATKEGDIVFDCFMGSGTTQAVALKLGRKFIGADINLGAVQTTSKRLLSIINDNKDNENLFNGFEVYNVNNYDFFRNPIEAKELIMQAFEVQPLKSNVFDGELDGRMIKIMPVNRIATRVDLEEIKSNLPYDKYEDMTKDNLNECVERITLICMGHEPDLKAEFLKEIKYNIDVEIVDILKDKSMLEFKREAEADIIVENNILTVESFYPMNLLQKLSMQKENVEDWRQLVDSIMIDFNYNGEVMAPQIQDVPEKNCFVNGKYEIPLEHGRIRVKITDILSESIEKEV